MNLIERNRLVPILGPNGYENNQEEASDDPIILAAKKCLLESEKVNVSMLRGLSAKLLKCKNQEEEVLQLLKQQIEARIRKMNPFPSCLPQDIVVQIAEYVPSEDQIENLVELPFKMVKARMDERTRTRIHALDNCFWIGTEAARAVENDPRVNRDLKLVFSEFSEFFLYAQLHQQEVAVAGWTTNSKYPYKIFDLIPKEMESLFLDFDILEKHPEFPQIFNLFSNLKILKILKDFAINSLNVLNQINFSNLEELDLQTDNVYVQKIKDQELEQFMDNPSLKNLKKLNIRNLKISKNCIVNLQSRFPNLEIVT